MATDLMADAISGPTYQVMSNAESHCKDHQRFELGLREEQLTFVSFKFGLKFL